MTVEDIEAILTLSPVTWVMLLWIIKELRKGNGHEK